MELKVSSLFKQNNVMADVKDAPITVLDLSRGGIGFESNSILPIGYYFNAKLEIGGKDSVLYSVVKIIRSHAGEDDKVIYGCEFVGLAPIFNYIFDEYEAKLEEENQQ